MNLCKQKKWQWLYDMLHVCIIDDGIDEKQLGILLHADIEITEDGIISEQFSHDYTADSHGTLCTGILLKSSPSIKLSSIKLKKTKKVSNSSHLVEALVYTLKLNVDVVHMSLGSTTYSDTSNIRGVIQELIERGIIIIAACNNKNIFTVPACLPKVIGVCTKRNIDGEYYEINKKSCDGIDYIASSKHMINGKLTPLSNSCAAPFITAKVCWYLSDNPKAGITEIKNHLDKNAVNYDGKNQTRQELIHTNPVELDNWYGGVRKICDIENPVVCIYDYPLDELIGIKNSFIGKGYNCLTVTNILQDDFLETEYINFSNRSIIENALRTLNTVYNPDLLIIGVYGMSEFRITDYINADIVCKDGSITTDEGETIKMDKDLFSQLYSILGGDDD